jgi:hypothetical protein
MTPSIGRGSRQRQWGQEGAPKAGGVAADEPPEQRQALVQEFKAFMKQSVENDSTEKPAEAERAGLL